MQDSNSTRVFVADDHPLVLEGMKALIAADSGLELIGQARDGASALQGAIELRPDVAVLDLSMPGLNGIEVAQRLLEKCPQCRILMLTVHEDPAYLRKLLDVGGAGYLLKRSATAELCRGIHAVAAGGVYLDPAIAGRLLHPNSQPEKADCGGPAAVELSAREKEVLRLTALGHSNKTIANTLHIGGKSVDTYKARAMTKLGFTTRVEVVRFAVRNGWLDED